jgi:RNA polymerase sigma factor (sigma-70 family)
MRDLTDRHSAFRRRPGRPADDPALARYLADVRATPRLDARAERRLAGRLLAAQRRLIHAALAAEAIVDAVVDRIVEPAVHGASLDPAALATETLAPLAAVGVIWRAHALAGCRQRPGSAPGAAGHRRPPLAALLAALPLRPDWLLVAAETAAARGRLPAAQAAAIRRGHQAWRRWRDRLAEANLRLVVAVARTYAGPDTELGELVSAGTLGLLRAIERFDPARQTRLSTFATFWIRHAIRLALSDDPERRARLRRRPPPVHLRLDAPSTDDGATGWIDTLPAADPTPLERTIQILDAERLRAAVGRLAPPLRAALAVRYGVRCADDLPPDVVSRTLALSPQTLRRLARQALSLLRHRLGAQP